MLELNLAKNVDVVCGSNSTRIPCDINEKVFVREFHATETVSRGAEMRIEAEENEVGERLREFRIGLLPSG